MVANTSITMVDTIGPQAMEVFDRAGMNSVQDLKYFVKLPVVLACLREAVNTLSRAAACSTSGTSTRRDWAYWERLYARCVSIVFWFRSSDATDFVPHQYMCPMSLDWFQDPVTTADGSSYSRVWLGSNATVTGAKPVYENVALREAVNHYRLSGCRLTRPSVPV